MNRSKISPSCWLRSTLGSVLIVIGMNAAVQNTYAQEPNIVNSVQYPTAAMPFEALVTNSGHVLVSLVDMSTGSPNVGIEVFSPQSNGGLMSSCVNPPMLSPSATTNGVRGMGFFPGAFGVAATFGNSSAAFYHVTDLLGCKATGYRVDQEHSSFSFAVVVTHDEQFAFVASEFGFVVPNATLGSGITVGSTSNIGNIGVVRILRDNNGDFTGSQLVGNISTGGWGVTAILLSPDGSRLYVATQISLIDPTSLVQPAGNIDSSTGYNTVNDNCGTDGSTNGFITVIDVAQVEASPSPPPQSAILSTVAAGCNPVRLAMSQDGSTLWVAARADNRVVAFDATRLVSDPSNALLGSVDTGGTAPVGIELFHNDQWLAVANSNRFNGCTVNATGIAQPLAGATNATIIDVSSPGSMVVTRTIPTGCFPRNISAGPDDTSLYLTNFNSNTLQVMQATDISVSTSAQSVNEGGSILVTLSLGSALPYDITVPIAVTGTATVDGDFTLTQKSVFITAGTTSGNTTLNAVNDQCKENNEIVTLTIGGFPGFSPSSPVSRDVSITADPGDNNLCIDGHLYNADGSPAVGKPVYFNTQSDTTQRYGFTDANGYFIARSQNWASTNIPPDTYLAWWYSLHEQMNWGISSSVFVNVFDTSVGNLKYHLN